jgi:MFS superfamily sulfate permease-like transporter
MIGTWTIQSYFKTKQKMEWLVVPLIVVLAFVVGLLQAVFLGLAMSTFLFVGAFFRSGVVKFLSNGVSVRSTIERPLKEAKWLDQNGDLIQIIILQNYLFFGNASSILSYIGSMFDPPQGNIDPIFIPPLPRIVVLDLTLVTGMDTSAVDAFSDILSLCGQFDCKLFLAGVSPFLRQVMNLGGVKPETTLNRSERKLRFFSDLDLAVGKAEDFLVNEKSFDLVPTGSGLNGGSGFLHALRQIDEQVSLFGARTFAVCFLLFAFSRENCTSWFVAQNKRL